MQEFNAWFKSSRSAANGQCVEVMKLDDGSRLVRDSKNGDSGPVLTFTAAEFDAFADGVSRGEFA